MGSMERAAATRRPDWFQQRRADQNAAGVGAMAALKDKITQTILDRMIAAVSGAGGFMVGNVGGGLSAYVGAETMMALRQAGLEAIDDIVADALLNPARARILLTEPAKQAERGTLKMLARLYRQSAASTTATVAENEKESRPAAAR